MINDLKLCTIVTNQEGRISFDEDHMRLDARNPVIRVCDVVTLSHVHESTMSVHTGENVRASQRIQKLKRVCYSLLGSNILVVYIFGMSACLLSHVGRKSLYKYYISVCAHPLCSYKRMQEETGCSCTPYICTLIIILICIRACISYFIN